MPETYFDIKWPDGTVSHNYSPSSIIADFFVPGETYPVAEFIRRARDAMARASERVQQVHGFPCARARATLASIEAAVGAFTDTPNARITILDMHR